MTVNITSHPLGVTLPVKAQPGARKNEIRGTQNGSLKVSVTQAPEKGKANKAIIELLAKLLHLRKNQFELLSGDTASAKIFLVRDITPNELMDLIYPFL